MDEGSGLPNTDLKNNKYLIVYFASVAMMQFSFGLTKGMLRGKTDELGTTFGSLIACLLKLLIL